MRTKKEILYDHYDAQEFHPRYEEQIFDAMDEYAAQATRPDLFQRLEALEYPHREICGLCHRAVAVGFWVPDEIWAAVVHRSQIHSIHCLNCFTERADEKLIDWSKGIQFYPVSLRSHLNDLLA